MRHVMRACTAVQNSQYTVRRIERGASKFHAKLDAKFTSLLSSAVSQTRTGRSIYQPSPERAQWSMLLRGAVPALAGPGLLRRLGAVVLTAVLTLLIHVLIHRLVYTLSV